VDQHGVIHVNFIPYCGAIRGPAIPSASAIPLAACIRATPAPIEDYCALPNELSAPAGRSPYAADQRLARRTSEATVPCAF
jgi:hypothetical protein